MNLQLMKLRKLAGYKSRDAFAKKIGVNRYTYRSWESGAAMMSLEQACMIADILDCTLDELAGRTSRGEKLSNPYERELVDCYRESTDQRKASILQTARDAAGMSKDASKRDIHATEMDRAV